MKIEDRENNKNREINQERVHFLIQMNKNFKNLELLPNLMMNSVFQLLLIK
jgi:hypothetical protein